jgi:Fe2+ or Zn2+ uptake regulation protein
MSVEHNHYHLTCRECGHTGEMERCSDELGRWEATVTGFDDTVVHGAGSVFGGCPQCGALGTIET